MFEMDGRRRMARFVADQGGRIDFSQFMKESLYGKGGYYREVVSIGKGDDDHFITFSERDLFARLMWRHFKAHLVDMAGGGRLLELAGGNGSFKRNLLGFAREDGFNLDYLSLDISERLIVRQARYGNKNILANGTLLPFADSSIEGVIFMNELIDVLPFRVVRFANSGGPKFWLEELSYAVADSTVVASWERTDDPALTSYWKRQLRYVDEAGVKIDWPEIFDRPFCVCLDEERLMAELSRVLRKGQIVIADYGDTIDRMMTYGKRASGVRVYPHNWDISLEELPEVAYEMDITTNVNFSDLMGQATSVGLRTVFYDGQSEYLSCVVSHREEVGLDNMGLHHPWNDDDPLQSHDLLLRDTSNVVGGFKILVLQKP